MGNSKLDSRHYNLAAFADVSL